MNAPGLRYGPGTRLESSATIEPVMGEKSRDQQHHAGSGAPGWRFEFIEDPRAFLARAGMALAAKPVVTNVVATAAQRLVNSEPATEPFAVPQWFACLFDGDAAVSAAMRTRLFPGHPIVVLPMPGDAAAALAALVHARGERIGAVNGALPAAHTIATETARLAGGQVRVAMRMRLFELDALIPPRTVPGRLRLASPADRGLVCAWLAAFAADADQQAGRPSGSTPDIATPEYVERRIGQGSLSFWEFGGRPVTLVGASPPVFAVSRIGPVYTPPELRGRGYASAAVAEVSADLLAHGIRPCLYTDQANPTSNRIYQALGYLPVLDQANLLIETAEATTNP